MKEAVKLFSYLSRTLNLEQNEEFKKNETVFRMY